MNAGSAKRWEINRKIRAVFVRHRIDLGALSIQATSQTIRIHGTLKRLPGVAEDLTPTILDAMFADLERIPGVGGVETDFDNWRRMGSARMWQQMGRSPTPFLSIVEYDPSHSFDVTE